MKKRVAEESMVLEETTAIQTETEDSESQEKYWHQCRLNEFTSFELYLANFNHFYASHSDRNTERLLDENHKKQVRELLLRERSEIQATLRVTNEITHAYEYYKAKGKVAELVETPSSVETQDTEDPKRLEKLLARAVESTSEYLSEVQKNFSKIAENGFDGPGEFRKTISVHEQAIDAMNLKQNLSEKFGLFFCSITGNSPARPIA